MSPLAVELEVRLGEWQKRLIWEQKHHVQASNAQQAARRAQVVGRQRELLEAVARGSEALSEYLRRELQLPVDDGFNAPLLPRVLTGAEVREPPLALEQELGEAWQSAITPAQASRPLFWARSFTDWLARCEIQGDLISALTRGGNADRGGYDEDSARSRREAQTRNFLRRVMGIPVVRFNVSVLSDCTISRAWWRFRLAQITEEESQGRVAATDAHRILHARNPAWEEIVRLAVRRVTVIGQPRALAVVVAHFVNRGDMKREAVAAVVKRIARHALRHSVAHTPWDVLQRTVARAEELPTAGPTVEGGEDGRVRT